MWLILWRFPQAVGGSMLQANSAAILTDAFPAEQRGFALGTNQVAGLAGMFVGLVAGGLLASVDWRAVFWVNVPVGIYGTVWAYLKLRETRSRTATARIDWWGNVTFAVGLSAILVASTYGIQPYSGHVMGWTNPWVLAGLIGGALLLVVFVLIERRVKAPMLNLALFRIRAFSAGKSGGLHDGSGPRRSAVHDRDLVAGDLAAAARLQLHPDSAVGRDLHVAADGRFPGRRADLRHPL